jgi:hypothetical protein
MSVESKLLVLLPTSTGSLIAICPKEMAAADALTQEVIKTIMGVSGARQHLAQNRRIIGLQ